MVPFHFHPLRVYESHTGMSWPSLLNTAQSWVQGYYFLLPIGNLWVIRCEEAKPGADTVQAHTTATVTKSSS